MNIYIIYIIRRFNIYIYIYIYIYYIYDYENNVLTQFSPGQCSSNSSTWAHNVMSYIVGTNQPKNLTTG